MARKTAREAEETRRTLIEAGIERFAQRGYADAALDELMSSLCVTRGALYHHFHSKRGFFEAVVETVQQRLGRKIIQAAARAGEGWAGIEAGCMTFLGAATDPVYRQIVIVDGPAALGWQTWKQLDDRYLTSTLQVGLEALDLADEAEPRAVALSGAMNELALWVAHHAKPRAALRRARKTIRQLLAASRS